MATATSAASKTGASKSKAAKSKGAKPNGKTTPATGKQIVQVAKGLTRAFLDGEKIEDKIKTTRSKWKNRIDAGEASLKTAIEADDDGTERGARKKVGAVCTAWQGLEEARAGRKSAMSLLLAERKEVKGKLTKQVETVKQLGLFDNV